MIIFLSVLPTTRVVTVTQYPWYMHEHVVFRLIVLTTLEQERCNQVFEFPGESAMI